MKISVALTYCTNDHVFLKSCIDHVLPFSEEVIVSSCDHYWNGEKEDLDLLGKDAEENPKASFVTFGYDPQFGTMEHNILSRRVAVAALEKPTDYILFLDADEIIEPDTFAAWWKNQQQNLMDCYKLGNYWYFRDFKFRTRNWENSVALVKNDPSCINDSTFDPRFDRDAFFRNNPTSKKVHMALHEGKPFVHHYSWVRSKETMLQKVRAWGHNKDKDWVSLVHKEFEQPFRGTDLIFPERNNVYDVVEPYINLKIQ
jgi:hypothetical protein